VAWLIPLNGHEGIALRGRRRVRMRLATKFSTTIVGVVALSIASSVIALVAAWDAGDVLERTVAENVQSIRDAEDLAGNLLRQKGLAARYFLENESDTWLKTLEKLEPRFLETVAEIRNTTHVSDKEADTLNRLEKAYAALDERRKAAIALYQKGSTDRAKDLLLANVNESLYDEAYDLCQEFIAASNQDIQDTTAEAMTRIRRVAWLVGLSVALSIGLGGMLLWMFFYRVLIPLRGMAADTRVFRGDPAAGGQQAVDDELRAVGDSLRTLMSDVADSRSRLERSRQRLLSAEKLAAVGKLAAGVAHEIRNPLTAMKMWLFSIQEAVQGNCDVERKVRVVSEEVARLESIVRSFLEFSRPPALRRQPHDVGEVIERTLELFGPRLSQKRIRLVRKTAAGLPPVLADPDQLKQVFINLLANSVEAMGEEGEIRLAATAERDADGRAMVVVRVQDAGPGMPEELRGRIFEPFFTTKDEGTGLGLCIAAQIMARHQGLLVLESSTDQGTTFAVWTPTAPRPDHGQDSRS